MSLKTDMNLVWSDRLTRAWHFGSIQTHDKDLDKVLVDDHDSYNRWFSYKPPLRGDEYSLSVITVRPSHSFSEYILTFLPCFLALHNGPLMNGC